MALKPNREEKHYDITWRVLAACERGGVVSEVTVGSGGMPGQKQNVAAYAANPSGQVPVGLLLYDVVAYDTNRQHENWEKAGFVALTGRPVALIKDGWVETNMTSGTISAMGPAYLAPNGLVSPTQLTGAPKVGSFLSTPDQNGYVKLRVDIP